MNESVLESVKQFPNQIKSAWDSVSEFEIDFENISNVVVCGMGGSALGARILKSYTSKIPIIITNHYDIPDFVDQNTLLIISSYSGNTEETVSCFNQALEEDNNIFVISTGGKLAEIAKENNVLFYEIDPKENPSKQPRLASGYSIGAMLAIFSKLNILEITKSDLDKSLEFDMERIQTDAKAVSENLKDKSVLFVTSEHLYGAVYSVKNMLNESAKNFSAIFELPELNHHLMEGLSHPGNMKDFSTFFFIESDLYHDRVQKRYPITKEVIQKNQYQITEYKAYSETKLKQIFEVLIMGSFLQVFLGEYYNEDLTKIPWVDYFKDELKKV